MVEEMKGLFRIDADLTDEEMCMLSMAYKNLISTRRDSRRTISSLEKEEVLKGSLNDIEMIQSYRMELETELRDICLDIIDVLDNQLIPTASTEEAKVFYYKLKDDYHRYMAEFGPGNERKKAAESSLISYKSASDKAITQLSPTHPKRLGLALNMSVLYYDILKCPVKAHRLAKTTLDDAVGEIDNLIEEISKPSRLIIQLIRGNLRVWTYIMERTCDKDSPGTEDNTIDFK